MKTIEQQIWDYLDGACTEQEREKIAQLIETDLVYKNAYAEFKALHQQLDTMELDEPSMGFTRNVMEKVVAETAPGAIRSLIDKRIIYGIAAFFLVSILVLLAVAFNQIDWSKPAVQVLPDYKLPQVDFSSYLNSTVLRSFFLVDLVLGLYILDSVMRKRMLSK